MGEGAFKMLGLMRDQLIRFRRIVIILILLLQTIFANYLAFFIRFETVVSPQYLGMFFTYLPILLLFRLLVSLRFGLYKGLWRYASVSDLLQIINSATIASLGFFVTVTFVFHDAGYPRSIFVLDWLVFIIVSGGTRLFIRVFKEYMFLTPSCKRVVIVGAGDTGEMIVREMRNNHEHAYEPIGFIDDDIQKMGLTIHGVPILGTCTMIPQVIEKHKPEEILISVPAATQKSLLEIYEICKPYNVPIKKFPRMNEILDGNVSVASRIGHELVGAGLVAEEQIEEALELQKREGGRLGSKLVKLGYITEESLVAFLNKQRGISLVKPISLEDLLQREQVKTDISSVRALLEGKSVMVTGAGGSIGSELCRQIIKYSPSHLLLLDRYENTLYEIDLELRGDNPRARITAVIGDIQDVTDMDFVFGRHRPQIVFHAAAYKHVPLMEHNPIVAVKNNVFGTKNLIETAAKHGVEKFVMISTDKAVNPTSVMGATKRIAEFLTINMNCSCSTRFTTVRFGNVLGTNGSVVPVFKEQLRRGGPLTVTHPEIKRFFMLIPEAVQLVLISAASGEGGELFVLDMGEQIKILDLAENFIRLSGFIPHKEIKIRFTGLRPGEKLFEELFDVTERRVPTSHRKIMRAIPVVPAESFVADRIAELDEIIRQYAVDAVEPVIQEIVPNFRNAVPSGVVQNPWVKVGH